VKAWALARIVLPLCVAGLVVVAIVVVAPFLWAIFWFGLAATVLLAVAGLWWRQRIIRDEATRPFVPGPEPRPGATRSLERKVVPGVVISRKEVAQ
jgi:hypothetical protein